MSSDTEAGWVEYRSERTDPRGPAAAFEARYRPTGPVEPAAPGSLAAFLTDRRGLFAADPAGRLAWTAIRHAPWPLQPAEAEIRVDTMAAAHGITLPDVDPVLYFAKRLDVVAWWPRRLGLVGLAAAQRRAVSGAGAGPGGAARARSARRRRRPAARRGSSSSSKTPSRSSWHISTMTRAASARPPCRRPAAPLSSARSASVSES